MAFYYSRKILLAITLAIFLAGTSPRRVSGQNCGCADDECCSRTGDCGTGDDYCGEGCQEGPCYPASNTVRNATFSRSHPNQNCGCDPELCCSQSGDCGTGEDYCGEGCQEGPCEPPSNTVRNATFSRSHPNQDCDCDPELCCSQSGYCGTGEDYCGPGCREGPCF